MDAFKNLDAITIEELNAKIEKLEAQARKSICESCVSMTNQAHNQDCIIEELVAEILAVKAERDKFKDEAKQWKNQASYYLNSWDSTKQDLAMVQRFVKGIGQVREYDQVFKKEAI